MVIPLNHLPAFRREIFFGRVRSIVIRTTTSSDLFRIFATHGRESDTTVFLPVDCECPVNRESRNDHEYDNTNKDKAGVQCYLHCTNPERTPYKMSESERITLALSEIYFWVIHTRQNKKIERWFFNFPATATTKPKKGFFSRFMATTPALCRQEMYDCLENRDDDVKEYIPVKHLFAHLLFTMWNHSKFHANPVRLAWDNAGVE
jgi:hypothetical protein